MFAKMIDKKTALELAAKGKKVLVMLPGGKDSGWDDAGRNTRIDGEAEEWKKF